MFKYIIKRLGLMFITLWFIVTITFVSMTLMPGNPYNNEKLTKEDIAQLDAKYGFDQPVAKQYVNYMSDLMKGEMGESFTYKKSVDKIITKRYPVSFQLGIISVIVGTIIGILLGIVAALKRNTWADYLATIIAVIGVSFPSFVLASYTQYYLALKLGWFPVSYIAGGSFERLILPILSLSVFAIAQVARVTRTEMVEISQSNFINLARAKGVSQKNVNFKHAFRNTLISILTVLGPLAVALTTGSLVVERIFGIPGIGEVLVGAVLGKDIFLVTGVTLIISLQILLMYLLVDILYAVVDPRIRVNGGELMKTINNKEFNQDLFTFANKDSNRIEDIQGHSLSFWQDTGLRFKKNKAAMVSLVIFIVVLILAVSAPFVGGYYKKVEVNGKPYTNVIGDYTNAEFVNLPPRVPIISELGILDGEKDGTDMYKEAGVPDDMNFIFGTDKLGRDLYVRTMIGSLISIGFGLMAAVIDILLGVVLGGLSGYYGGKLDLFLQRIVEY